MKASLLLIALLGIAQTRIVLKGEKGDPGLAVDPSKVSALAARYVAKAGDTLLGPLVPANPARVLWVPSSHFMPLGTAGAASDTHRWSSFDNGNFDLVYIGSSNTTADMIATLHLPDGATVTSASCLVFDNDATNGYDLQLELLHLSPNGVATPCSSVDTSALPNSQSVPLALPLGACNPVVDNDLVSLNAFAVVISPKTPTSALQAIGFWGCSVSFDVAVAAP